MIIVIWIGKEVRLFHYAQVLFLALALYVAFPSWSSAQVFQTNNLLSDTEFSPSTILGPFSSSVLNQWLAENAQITNMTANGIMPQTPSGSMLPVGSAGMLQMSPDNLTTSQARQYLNISAYAVDIDAGKLAFNASARLNCPPPTVCTGGISIRDTDTNALIGTTGFTLDLDASTFEAVEIGIDNEVVIPSGTRRIYFEIGYTNSGIPQDGFVDRASLTLRTAGCHSLTIDNASFESPDITNGFTTYQAGEVFGGWTVVQGSIDLVSSTVWVPADGDQSIDLSGQEPGTITRSFPTLRGVTYQIDFDMAANESASGEIEMEVSAAGVVQNYSFFSVPNDGSNLGWIRKSFIFTALSSQTSIRFKSLVTQQTFWGPALDNISGLSAACIGEINGCLIDRNGQPLPTGITITTGGRATETDGAGCYSFPNLPIGDYTVRPFGKGYTFGSTQFQTGNYSTTITSASLTKTVNPVGYNRNPVVFIHGWNSDGGLFDRYENLLGPAGYNSYDVEYPTNLLGTPPLLVLSNIYVPPVISLALNETGQDKVIIISHSLGGLVGRGYMEGILASFFGRNTVSQYFSMGTPHLGIFGGPAVLAALNPGQFAVRDMLAPSMVIFNIFHLKRNQIDYHIIGGKAPMYKILNKCWKIFGVRFCIPLAPWPDFEFRNGLGFALGLLTIGADDATISTFSSTNRIGASDSSKTREVHSAPSLGSKSYVEWDGGTSQETYLLCVKRILVDFSASSCNLSKAALLPPAGIKQDTPVVLELPAGMPDDDVESTAPEILMMNSGQVVSRNIVVQGGETTFTATIEEGTIDFHLVDPNGMVFDAAYAASIETDDIPDANSTIITVPPPEVVLYANEAGGAMYYVPNATPGVWTIVATGQPDIPAVGSQFVSQVAFDGTYMTSLDVDQLFYTPGDTATITLNLPTIASANISINAIFQDGSTLMLAPIAGLDSYSALFTVPNVKGAVRFEWSVVGIRLDNVGFERGGIEFAQIISTELSWGGFQSESTSPRSEEPSLYEALILNGQVTSTYTGTAEIFARIVDAADNFVTSTTKSLDIVAGTNNISITVDGAEIFASGLNGPYTVKEVLMLDTQNEAILAVNTIDGYVSQGYDFNLFTTHIVPEGIGFEDVFGEVNINDEIDGPSSQLTIDGVTFSSNSTLVNSHIPPFDSDSLGLDAGGSGATISFPSIVNAIRFETAQAFGNSVFSIYDDRGILLATFNAPNSASAEPKFLDIEAPNGTSSIEIRFVSGDATMLNIDNLNFTVSSVNIPLLPLLFRVVLIAMLVYLSQAYSGLVSHRNNG